MQLQAGYILQGLPELYVGRQREYVDALIKRLSFFDFENIGQKLEHIVEDPFVVIIYNIINRGLPTFAPAFIEEIISATFFNTTKNVDNRGNISYEFVKEELKDDIFRALHIIDPRLQLQDIKEVYTFEGDPEADLKKKFVFETLPVYIGDYVVQLLCFERNFGSIIRNYSLSKYFEAKRKVLLNYNFDFVLEAPYTETEQFKGLAIEIEKKLIDDESILDLDKRSWFLTQIGWGEIFYLKQSDFYPNTIDYVRLQEFFYNIYFEYIRKNYERPLYNHSYGLDALQLALTSFEVARIQRVVIEYILAGILDLNDKEWNIAVIERDIPGAFLALQDLSLKFNHLYQLAGIKRKFPQINLELFYSKEFESAALNVLYQGDKFLIDEFEQKKKYNLVIDSSILRYNGLEKHNLQSQTENIAIIRSSKFIDSHRHFLTTEPITYKKFVFDNKLSKEEILEREKAKEGLLFFVKDIFHRQELTDIQLNVLSNVLTGKNTIVNIPFIYEKTLLYQIIALLQPGMVMVIEPLLISLQDQIEKLSGLGIDAFSTISASYGNINLLDNQIDNIVNGRALFVFITAEDLHTNELRQIFKLLSKNKYFFSLVIVDQVDFMSPFSMNFNYAYYTILKNLKRVVPLYQDAILLGLSSGMDLNVQADVLNLLEIDKANLISHTYDFENIEIIAHPIDRVSEEIDFKLFSEEIEKAKVDFLLKNYLIEKQSLLFTHFPEYVFSSIVNKERELNVGVFDEEPRTEIFSFVPYNSLKVYKSFFSFRRDNYQVLVANRNIAYGLDKADIRNLILMSLPVGFGHLVKLLQRVGRDGKTAKVYFVLSKQKLKEEQRKYITNGKEITEIKQNLDVFYEQNLIDRFLYRSNLQKDFLLINELLNNIENLNDTLETLLIRRINQIFGIKVNFDFQPTQNPTMLYIYENEELLGILDFENNEIKNVASALEQELAEAVLNFLDSEIRILTTNPKDILLIIKDKLPERNTSIMTKLVSIRENEQTTVEIDFENNIPEKIVSLFPNSNLTIWDVKLIYRKSYDYNSFKQFLQDFLDKKISRKKAERIKDLYNRLRLFEDTYRIVYYFVEVGLVDDYFIDFRNQQFILHIYKLSDDKYLSHVYKRISVVISREKSLEVFQKVPSFMGNSFVQKVLNYWVSFKYSYIQNYHEDSIKNLSELISSLYNNKDYEKCKLILSHYFEAKYIFDLQKIRDFKKIDWIKIIDYFIDKVGVFKANIRHLYKTGEILYNQDNQDYIALMLRGWAGLILDEGDEMTSKALDDIVVSLNICREKEGVNTEEFITWIETLFLTLENYSFELKTKIEELFYLKFFTNWLKEFNNHFVDLT